MTLKLQLSPNLERRLEAEAAKLGLLLEVYALTLIEKQLSAETSRQPAPAQPRRRPGLLRGELGDAFFEPLPPEELAAWES